MNLKTQKNYESKAQQIKRQIAKKLDYTSPNLVPITILVDHIISNKENQSHSTWRQYKAAISHHITQELANLPDSEGTLREELKTAHRVLAKETSEGTNQRGSGTSSNKQKAFKDLDIIAVQLYLSDHLKDHQYANALDTWIKASLITGLRPSEWEEAHIKNIDGQKMLVVKNAKFNGVRANGEYRHLLLDDLNQEALDDINEMLTMLDGYIESRTFTSLYESIRDYMKRVARKSLGTRVKYPSLYSLRHQFIANAKASGFSRQEIAALIGHASDVTASKHYARKVSGKKGSVAIKPLESEVDSVRLSHTGFSFANYKLENKKDNNKKLGK